MKIYSVTVTSGNGEQLDQRNYNLYEHDSDAFRDPTTQKPIGRVCLATKLTWAEANAMKNELDIAQGTHPLQRPLEPLLPPDAKPSTTIISMPKGGPIIPVKSLPK